MNEIIDTLNGYLGPVVTGKLGHALVGLAILIVGLIIVRFIASAILRMLKKVNFLNRVGADGATADLATPIGGLIKAVLTIFVLMAVLQHFGLTNVLAPLQEMVNKFTGAVPNIIGAGVIAYAGWIIAKMVSELAGVGLNRVDGQIAERTGNADMKIAGFGSAFIFGIILLPIVVSALGVLNIPAISGPASAMIQKLMAAIPNVVGAGIILLVAYFVAKFVIHMLTGLLEGANINALPARLGISGLFSESFTPTKLVGGGIMLFSMLAAATAAVTVLGIDVISNVFSKVLEFGGGLFVGALILVVGNFLSNVAYQKMSLGGSSGLANISRVAILGLVLAMGLKAMGLADNIVNMAFGFTIGGVAVASALAFGLGGKDAAKKVADGWAEKISSN
ncbi:MAG: mechanosensitive ion channel [Gammaproteobacteria bacterium]|nr:mechanosensitive ion channel [Gammaproteobacteria bacterium]